MKMSMMTTCAATKHGMAPVAEESEDQSSNRSRHYASVVKASLPKQQNDCEPQLDENSIM